MSSGNQWKPGSNGQIATNGNVNSHANGNQDSFESMSEGDDVPLATHSKSEPGSQQVSTLKRKKPVNQGDTSSDDNAPLASSSPSNVKSIIPISGATTNHVNRKRNSKRKASSAKFSDTDDDGYGGDESLDRKPKTPDANRKANAKPPPKKKAKMAESDAESDSEDDKPFNQMTSVRKRKVNVEDDASVDETSTAKKVAPKKVKKDVDISTSDSPKSKRKSSKTKREKGKEDVDASPKKGKSKRQKEEGEAEEVFKWWEAQEAEGDDSIKWQTLEHKGVYFPPPYEPLPKDVKMRYNGKAVELPPAAEEVAGFYAAMIETDHAQDQTFNKNFFDDWQLVLKKNRPLDGTKITSFDLCDFRPMYEYFESEKAKKKALTSAQKKEFKKAKDDAEANYTTCLLDGRKEKIGNFRVEPPGLFRGRGDHPKKGALKFRVRPEDITINIGKGVPIPEPNMPGTWKNVIHDQTVTWLANWTENVNGNHKYVFLAAGSSLKGQSDMIKFEKARELKNHVDRIREEYTADLKNKVMADRMRATAMYFIDRLALRAGNEKGEDEADTVGCCSLRCEHVTLEAPNFIIFDFLGKDSIRYYNRVAVDAQVFKNVRIFKQNKNDDDNLFDRVNTSLLNKHLASKMKGLTAKVFRTYNASITFQEQLDNNTPDKATVQEKFNAYNQANRMVAILCNHQRSVPKTHEQSMEKMRYKLRSLKYERMKLRHVLFKSDPKFKKKKKYADDESDIDEEWIATHEEQLKAKEIEKAEKKFAKENEKLIADGQKSQKDNILNERIKDIEDDFKQLEKERGTGKASLKREKAAEKIEEDITKLEDKIKISKLQIEDRDAGKEVALGTSKINYLDPRITAAWCKMHDVPIEKIFSKTLLVKFPWAMEVDDDWKF